jgi:hypothetical protein
MFDLFACLFNTHLRQFYCQFQQNNCMEVSFVLFFFCSISQIFNCFCPIVHQFYNYITIKYFHSGLKPFFHSLPWRSLQINFLECRTVFSDSAGWSTPWTQHIMFIWQWMTASNCLAFVCIFLRIHKLPDTSYNYYYAEISIFHTYEYVVFQTFYRKIWSTTIFLHYYILVNVIVVLNQSQNNL